MVDLAPFRGVRYTAGHDLADVTAPPYDAIDPGLSHRLHQRSAVNVVRLERAEPHEGDRAGRNRYELAADTYHRWIEAGVVARDPRPALYVYEQQYTHGDEQRHQRGVLAALRLVPWGSGDVLPHEQIFRPPVEDRLRLLAALPVNTSPVYVLAPAEPPEVTTVLDEVSAGRADAVFTDPEDGVTHRLWVIADSDMTAAVRAAYAPARLLMADGHHRYTGALQHHDTRPGPGTGRILAYVVAPSGGGVDRAGPVVRAMHRLVRRLASDVPRRLAEVGARLVPVADEDADLRRIATVLDERPTARFGLVTRQERTLVEFDDVAAEALAPRDVPAEVRHLDVALLDALLSGPLQVDQAEEVRYTPDARAAAGEVMAGSADALFVLRPVTLDRVRAVADAGLRMPPKTTSFFPKPRTGLVLRPLE
ncbi:MAG: DUF1015 domain-containing protein [Actinomycetota bacterium]|nr:DUF1015 domain-containing protein [Actinomycetota bacterium]